MKWTRDQVIARSEVLSFLKTVTPKGDADCIRIHKVTGGPGVGKSTMLTAVLQDVKQWNPNCRISFTATTHTAVSVLRGTIGKTAPDITLCTMQSLFGFIPSDDNEHQFTRRVKEGGGKDFDVIVIDEASILADRELSYVIDEAIQYGIKIILVYDAAQLGPVIAGTLNSERRGLRGSVPVEHVDGRESRVTEYVRFSSGPLETLARQVREAKLRGEVPNLLEMAKPLEGDAIRLLPLPRARKEILEKFSSDEAVSNVFYGRVLAYRNQLVDGFNDAIRQRRYREQYPGVLPPVIPGEVLRVKKSYKGILEENHGDYVLHTNTYVEILSVEPSEIADTTNTEKAEVRYAPDDPEKLNPEYYNFPVFEGYLILLRTRDLDTGKEVRVWVNHICKRNMEFTDRIDALTRRARRLQESKKGAAGPVWRDKYAIERLSIQLSPATAGTVHTAQGLTVQHVYVVLKDLARCRDPDVRARLYVVAASRATKTLTLIY